MHQQDPYPVRESENCSAPSPFFPSGTLCSSGGSSDSESMRFQDIPQYFQRKENLSGLFSLVKERIFFCIINVSQRCSINKKTIKKSCCTRGKGGDVTITTDLCDLYEQMDGLRLACRRERAVLDRRVEWLKQVTDLVSRMEGVCDEFQNLIEAQPRRAEPYEVQEHIEQTIHSLTHAMNRIKEGEA